MVEDVSLGKNFHRTIGNIMLKYASNQNAIRCDGDRGGFFQPDMAVNSSTFVKPAFEFAGIHFHRDGVFAADAYDVRDVGTERIVTALVMFHEPAIDEYGRVAKRAIEIQPDAFARVRRRQIQRAGIPAD